MAISNFELQKEFVSSGSPANGHSTSDRSAPGYK